MKKINDRITLGVASGLIGITLKVASDEVFLRKKVSQRSYRETAAGVWVNNHREAKSPKGQILGSLLDLGMGMMGAIGQVFVLSKTGKDNLLIKGALFGMVYGSTITALLSALPTNKVKPKDATSNLSYMASHAIFGLGTTYAASMLGNESLWDAAPINNYLNPTQKTTSEKVNNYSKTYSIADTEKNYSEFLQ